MAPISNQTVKKILKKVKAGETISSNEEGAVYRHPLVGTTVRCNILTRPNYTPYCGNYGECSELPRTSYDGEQFVCSNCGWRSKFHPDFLKLYRLVRK